MQYTVLLSTDIRDLINQVNLYLKDYWRVCGNLVVFVGLSPDDKTEPYTKVFYYAQPLIREGAYAGIKSA